VTVRTTIIAAIGTLAVGPAVQAQAPALQHAGSLVPPRAIIRIVHSNGLDPVTGPVREGPTYVVRAINRRGLLMRVVVDAYSGQIRAVNRIVPGPGNGRRIAMRPLPPYGPPPQFGRVPQFVPPSDMPDEYGGRPSLAHAPRKTASAIPPLPRPRPANVVADAPPAPPPAETSPAPPAAPPGDAKPSRPAAPAPIND
jgi:hypothetical protein